MTLRNTKLITLICLLAAMGLGAAPQAVRDWLRTTIRDGLQPGVQWTAAVHQSAAAMLRQPVGGDKERELTGQISNLKAQVSELQFQLRRERLAHQRIRDEKVLALRRHFESRRPIDPPPLIVPQVIQANVLGEELARAWRAGMLLDRGKSSGLAESSLVLDESARLLDQGADGGLTADLPVFAGSCVIGKLHHVGRWSSTWVPLTDKRFSGRARLARVTAAGLIFGAEGVLVGNGQDSCRLTKIRVTEPVHEGDEVFALETPTGFESPLFYGTVTRAELTAAATHWDIEVRPAAEPSAVKSVSVVRPMVNARRLAN